MAARKKAAKKEETPSKIPDGLWQESPRNGIYKLYPGEEVEIEGIGKVTNNGKEVMRLVSGEELPS